MAVLDVPSIPESPSAPQGSGRRPHAAPVRATRTPTPSVRPGGSARSEGSPDPVPIGRPQTLATPLGLSGAPAASILPVPFAANEGGEYAIPSEFQ